MPSLQNDAPDLISAMLAAGYDRAAARWAPAVAPDGRRQCRPLLGDARAGVARTPPSRLSSGRISSFIGRDKSKDKLRSALLVAGLAGLGRISTDTANSLNRRYGLGLGRTTSWTRMIDAAAGRGQGGTVLVLTGTGFQTPSFDRLPAAHHVSRDRRR